MTSSLNVPSVECKSRIILHSPHPGPQQFTTWEDHLHTTLRLRVFSIRSISKCPIKSVAKDGSPSDSRNRRPKGQTSLLDFLVEEKETRGSTITQNGAAAWRVPMLSRAGEVGSRFSFLVAEGILVHLTPYPAFVAGISTPASCGHTPGCYDRE
jgi:hypothetical protein